MIQKSGVIYTYTPSSMLPASKQLAGTPSGSSKSALFREVQPQIPVKPFTPQPSAFPPKKKLPVSEIGLKRPTALPAVQKPFAKPPVFKKPFPPLPVSSKKPVPWSNPFDFDSFDKSPSPISNVKNIKEIAKPQEFYKGLPVEETPEMDIQLPPPSIDVTYVDKLFGEGMKNNDTAPVQTQSPQHELEKKAVETIQHTLKNISEQKQPETTQPHSQPSVPVHEQTPAEQKAKKRSPFDFLKPKFGKKQIIGMVLLGIAMYGATIPIIPRMKLEATYATIQKKEQEKQTYEIQKPLPPSIPIGVNPLMAPDGSIVEPVNTQFSIVIPAVGINAPVLAGINPLDPKSYKPALAKGVAHAKTSYLPDQSGTTYLFSHSTNYEWFVKDLNAIFYNVKNLKEGDYIVLFYKEHRYVYEYKTKKIVKPSDTSYLVPQNGTPSLILQTCWPPGSTTERLLLFADLVQQSEI